MKYMNMLEVVLYVSNLDSVYLYLSVTPMWIGVHVVKEKLGDIHGLSQAILWSPWKRKHGPPRVKVRLDCRSPAFDTWGVVCEARRELELFTTWKLALV